MFNESLYHQFLQKPPYLSDPSRLYPIWWNLVLILGINEKLPIFSIVWEFLTFSFREVLWRHITEPSATRVTERIQWLKSLFSRYHDVENIFDTLKAYSPLPVEDIEEVQGDMVRLLKLFCGMYSRAVRPVLDEVLCYFPEYRSGNEKLGWLARAFLRFYIW